MIMKSSHDLRYEITATKLDLMTFTRYKLFSNKEMMLLITGSQEIFLSKIEINESV